MNFWKPGLATGALVLTVGCGAAATPAPESVVIDTANRTPTPTPPATATPVPTPTPTVDIEKVINERVAEKLAEIQATQEARKSTKSQVAPAQEEPTNTPRPSPSPKPTATPTPIVRVRPIEPPESQTTASALKLASVSIQGDTLRVKGVINGRGHKPTSIQVWHALEAEPYSDTCSTERPIAFIRPGNGSIDYTGESSPYTWQFCRRGYARTPTTDQVPWLYSQRWSYDLRDRRRTNDPYVYDFQVSAEIGHKHVQDLRYKNLAAAGYRVIIFSGNTIIGNRWVGQ